LKPERPNRSSPDYGQGLQDAAILASVVIALVALIDQRQAPIFVFFVFFFGLIALLLRTPIIANDDDNGPPDRGR
jgi:hypothetical protein